MTEVRRLAPGERLAELDALYRQVFGLRPTDSGMNPRLLVALTRSGGHLVGAFEGDVLIGYGLALLARDATTGELHHYSQTVAVDAKFRGRGVGRAIKAEQRAISLADGIATLRWAYDPVQARNAHLNLDVLGAEVRTFVRDLYGTAAPGNDAGERTDRCIVTWSLADPPREPAPAPPAVPPGATVEVSGDALLGVPADWSESRAQLGAEGAAELRERLATAFTDLLGRGLVATSCRRVTDTVAVYRFTAAVAR